MIFLLKKNMKRCVADTRSFLPRPKPGGVRILMYHSVGGSPKDHRLAIRVGVDNFRAQLDEISRAGYDTLTVSDILSGVLSRPSGKFIAITFDDGYKDNITEAAAALRTRGMKATFFITTANINGKSVKKWSDGRPREYMNWDDVSRLGRMGFEIGSHMADHVDLTSLDDSGLLSQFEGSKNEITEKTGIEPKTFSYPYGRLNDRVVAAAKNAHYAGGCSSFKGLNRRSSDPLILRRTEIDGYDTISDFTAKIIGYYD
jgi:peptidoglycan/xylan/chitin deacetylase (PgdA/CDA1 family)